MHYFFKILYFLLKTAGFIRSCADPESFVRGGPTVTTFFHVVFLVDEGREGPKTTIRGPSLARQ